MDGERDQSDKIAALIASLEQSDKKTLRQGVAALISMADEAPEVAAKLRAALDRAPAEKRWPIAYVLARVSPLTPPCLNTLTDALGVDDPDIRWAVALLLVDLGKKPHSVVAAHLVDLAGRGHPTQRRMAVYCLRDIGAEDLLRTALLRALGDADPLVRVAAVTSMKNFAETGKAAMGELLRLVSADPDSRVQASAALALARLGPPDEKVLQALESAARSADLKLAKAARAALDKVSKRTIPDSK